MEKIACPQCSKVVRRHCDHCGWLQCDTCEVIFGKDNYFYYGKAAKQQANAEQRRNGG